MMNLMQPSFGQYFLNSDTGNIHWWNGFEWEHVHDTGTPQVLDILARFGGGSMPSPRSIGSPSVTDASFLIPPPTGTPGGMDIPTLVGGGGDSNSQTILGGGGGGGGTNMVVAGFLTTIDPPTFEWQTDGDPTGWVTDSIANSPSPGPGYHVFGTNAGYPHQWIYVGHGPSGAVISATTGVFGPSFGNSYCLMVFELSPYVPATVIHGRTQIGTDDPGSSGPAFVFPPTVADHSLLIAWMTRMTSALPQNQPASGWTNVPGFFDAQPLGDRQLVNAETRVVVGNATYTGLQSPEGVEGGNTAGVVVAAYPGPPTILRKGFSGNEQGGNTVSAALV